MGIPRGRLVPSARTGAWIRRRGPAGSGSTRPRSPPSRHNTPRPQANASTPAKPTLDLPSGRCPGQVLGMPLGGAGPDASATPVTTQGVEPRLACCCNQSVQSRRLGRRAARWPPRRISVESRPAPPQFVGAPIRAGEVLKTARLTGVPVLAGRRLSRDVRAHDIVHKVLEVHFRSDDALRDVTQQLTNDDVDGLIQWRHWWPNCRQTSSNTGPTSCIVRSRRSPT